MSSGKLSLVNSSLDALPIFWRIILLSTKIQIKELAEKNFTGRVLFKELYSAVGSSSVFFFFFFYEVVSEILLKKVMEMLEEKIEAYHS